MSEDSTHLQHRPIEHVVTTLRAEVVDGPDRGKHAMGNEALAVGTARDNALVISDFTVSRYHLEVAVSAGGIAISDLGSTNGTYVGAVRIDRATVPPGTPIMIGATTIRFDDAGRSTVRVDGRAHELAGMVACSPKMLRLFADIERVAATASSVLVIGESGTGKERVAEALHVRSPREKRPLVTVDCGAISSPLLASELFGHERGAFTGADRKHVGALERAEDGTVFLDEIGELPPADQAALLGVLERKRFRRVGGAEEVELRARVIAATNRDLRAEVNATRFRADLYHRIAVVVLRVPPLRERRDDIPVLVDHFARDLGRVEPTELLFGSDTLARWLRHQWPGNVRELRNAVEAALVGISVLGLEAGESSGPELVPFRRARAEVVAAFERDYVERLLARSGGNVSAAARLASMDRSHLIDLLHRHGLKD